MAFIALLALLLIARLIWGHNAQRNLDATVQAIRDAGEPIDRDDYPLPIPDGVELASTHLHAALNEWPRIEGYVSSDPYSELAEGEYTIIDTDWFNYSPQRDVRPRLEDPITDNVAYLQQIETLILPHLRAAAECEYAGWPIDWDAPPFEVYFPHLTQMRRLARLLQDAAVRAANEDRFSLSLEMIRHMLTIADFSRDNNGLLISHLVCLSIHMLASEAIETLLPSWEGTPNAEATAQAHLLIEQLLNEFNLQSSLVRAFEIERWAVFHTLTPIIEHNDLSVLGPAFDYPNALTHGFLLMVRPHLKNDIAYSLACLTRYLDASKSLESYADWQANDPSKEIDQTLAQYRIRYVLSGIMIPAISPAIDTHMQILMRRRLAATAIAIKLYELEHSFRPDRLNQLVPNYLPAVPTDLFSPDGHPVAYLPEGVQLIIADAVPNQILRSAFESLPRTEMIYPLLYSLGANQIDDGGTAYLNAEGKLDQQAPSDKDSLADRAFLLVAPPDPMEHHRLNEFYEYEPIELSF